MYYFLDYFQEYFDLFFLSLGLLMLMISGTSVSKRDRKIIFYIVVSILLLSVCEYVETLFDERFFQKEIFWRYLFSTICYILRPSVLVLFYHIKVKNNRKAQISMWIPSIINTVVYLLAFLAYKHPSMRFVYWYNESNQFGRAWLGYTAYAVCALYLLSFLIISIIDTKKGNEEIQVNLVIIFTSIVAVISFLLATYFDDKYTYMSDAYILGALFYYMYLCYEAAYHDATMHEREMQDKTTALMLSQIQPHFIYNTLATIRVLCDIDPNLAGETIDDFSKYLRVNTDALSKKEPVLINDEVAHAKAYAKIEMLRFDNVKVEFDIQDQDFTVPVLTIQPMVENAIKYGVRHLEHGLVTVRTYKEDDRHVLVIEDNGKGFDVNSIGSDGRNHVGVANVRTRIRNMVHGTFEITSEIDKGTKIIIKVPEVK